MENLSRKPIAPAFASAILAVLLYAITLGGTYIYDDVVVVKTDARMHSLAKWSKLWTESYNGGGDNLYRPLVSSSYALEWFVHGDRPWMFHLVNVLLNAAVAAAVAELTRRGLGSSTNAVPAAFIAGMLFAAHPLHVEAVANIVGRAELACALATLGGLLIIAHRPLTTARVIALLICGFAGVLSKEQGILQPLFWIIFGLLLWKKNTDATTDSTTNATTGATITTAEPKAIRLLTVLTLWLWAGYLIGREHFLRFEWDMSAMDPTMQPLMRSVGLDRILMPVALIGHYTALFVWPAHLSLDYGGDVIGFHARFNDPYLWIGFAAIGCWCFAILFAWIRRANFIVFCLLAMAITYGLVGNIVTLIGTNFGERLMYLPTAFLLMAIAAAITRLTVRMYLPIVAVALIFSSWKTVTAAADWNTPLLLYQHSVAGTPKSIQARLLLAEEYARLHNRPAVDATLDQICREYPDYWRVWLVRASAAIDEGDLHTARQAYNRAYQLNASPALLGVQGRLTALEATTRPAKQ
jgi:hypothetical protein